MTILLVYTILNHTLSVAKSIYFKTKVFVLNGRAPIAAAAEKKKKKSVKPESIITKPTLIKYPTKSV